MSNRDNVLSTPPYEYANERERQEAAAWFESLMASGELDKTDATDRSLFVTARKEVRAFKKECNQ